MWKLGGKKKRILEEIDPDEFEVSILMAVYNEEQVLEEKLSNLQSLDFPTSHLKIFVGSDASTDNTISILDSFSGKFPGLQVLKFSERRGKPAVLNDLAVAALAARPAESNHIFLITDANVFLAKDLLKHVLRSFKDEDVALVDTRMINTGTDPADISTSEAAYISLEGKLKLWESTSWKMMMGPFGGCYSLRSSHFREVPAHFLVDDFYIAMRVFESGGRAVNDPAALCYEAVSHDIEEEFRRKARISAGNFQNLELFWHFLKPPISKLGFVFLSHKVLRWLTPFLFLLIWFTSGILAISGNFWFSLLFFCQTLMFILLPVLDRVLASIGFHLLPLRHIRYFIRMNVALLKGFGRYLRGIKKGAWEPTKRTKTT